MEKILGKLFILEGAILGLLGFIFFTNPVDSLLTITNISGWIFLILGVVVLVKENRNIPMGIVDILFGITLISLPITSVDILIVIYGSWSVVRGVILLALTVKYKGFSLNLGTIYYFILIILGVIILVNPTATFLSIPYIIGTYFIISSIWELYIGFKID